MIVQWETLDLNAQLNLVYQALIAIIMLVMMTYFFAQSVKLRDVTSQKHFYLGLGGFVAFNLITQLIWTIDKWIDAIRTVENPPGFDGSYVVDFVLPFVGKGAINPYLFMLFLWGFASVCWPVEKYVRNSKRFPITVINLIGAIAMAAYTFVVPWFFPGISDASPAWETLEYAMYGVLGIGAIGLVLALVLIIGFYLVLGGKTSGSVRKKSILIAFGFMLVIIGLLLTQLPKEGNPWIGLISPSVMIVGFIFLGTGYRIQI
ncbi:MAG: hypothetical protein JW839_14560 [Candidatus Lokiarchaeota archaeon]|nr:hypothetical protein [Candidatus Lokiarchaeota archaeon]